jgi:hypothetical protein
VKSAQKTRVFLDNQDISHLVFGVTLRRFPEEVECVDLVLVIDSLEIDPDGALVINIETGK